MTGTTAGTTDGTTGGTTEEVPFDLVAEVCARFGLGAPLDAARSVGRNNRSWRVTTADEVVHLREVRGSKGGAALGFEHTLTERLAAGGVPVARWRPAPDGAPWLVHGGATFVVQPFVTGERPARSPRDAALCGTALAATHRVLRDAGPVPDVDHPALHEMVAARLPGLPAADARAADEVRARVEAVWNGKTLVHGGARRSSYLLAGGEVVAVLDLDSARPGPAGYDLATLVNSFARDNAAIAAGGPPLREPLVRAIVAGYAGPDGRAVDTALVEEALVLCAGLVAKRALSPTSRPEDAAGAGERRQAELAGAVRLAGQAAGLAAAVRP